MEEETGMSKKHILGFKFIILFIFWILLSIWALDHNYPGQFNALHLTQGLVASAIVVYLLRDLILHGEKLHIKFLRAIPYVFWELWQIVLANIDVAYRVLHPKLPINPLIIEFYVPYKGDMTKTWLANSITLTPGTITILVEGRRFIVHALDKSFADPLLIDQTMQRKLMHVFMEGDYDSST